MEFPLALRAPCPGTNIPLWGGILTRKGELPQWQFARSPQPARKSWKGRVAPCLQAPAKYAKIGGGISISGGAGGVGARDEGATAAASQSFN